MKHHILPILGIALAVYACIDACENSPPKQEVVQEEIIEDSLSSENLLSFIVSINMDSPIIVLKQAILETDHFRSYGCHELNNLFGLKGKNGYLRFDTWQNCCRYYKDMQCRRYNGEDYYKWLTDIGWAEDDNYIKSVKHVRL